MNKAASHHRLSQATFHTLGLHDTSLLFLWPLFVGAAAFGESKGGGDVGPSRAEKARMPQTATSPSFFYDECQQLRRC